MNHKFNPEGSQLRKMQLRMLEMLKYLDKVCKDNSIQYWLSSGTCLGSVRHRGFIPWDDDIDIELLEPDYQRLLNVLGFEPKDGYVLQSSINEPNYVVEYAKLRDLDSVVKEKGDYDTGLKYRGLSIDLFHLQPSSSYLMHRLAGLLYWRGRKYGLQESIGRKISRLFFSIVYKLSYPLIKACDSIRPKGGLRHALGSPYPSKRYYNEIFPLKTGIFEGYEFPIPGNVDKYLERMFGSDYMTPPPADKIRIHAVNVTLFEKK